MSKLNPKDLEAQLPRIPGWKIQNAKLHREFIFKNFVECFSFMTQVALFAEQMDHHPEWSNVYNKLTIELTTHSAGGISEKDFQLAEKINSAADPYFKGR